MHRKSHHRGLFIERLESRTLMNNTLATAIKIGGDRAFAGSFSINETSSDADTVDIYRLLTDSAGNLALTLSGQNRRLRLSLVHDKNRNGVEDTGDLLRTVIATPPSTGVISLTTTQSAAQEIYYIKVLRVDAGTTPYSLDMTYDTAGGTGLTARKLNNDADGAFGRHEINEGVDFTDATDVYRFSFDPRVASAAVAVEVITTASTRYHVDLFRDTNSNLVLDPSELMTTFQSSGGPITLTAGARYFLRVVRSSGGLENYKLRTLFDYAGNTIPLARNISGIDEHLSSFRDQVGDNPAIANLDGQDFYRFTVSSPQTLFLELSLIENPFSSARVQADVFQDSNNDNFFAPSEQLATTGTVTGSATGKVEVALPPPGTTFPAVLYIRISGGVPSANYQLRTIGDRFPGIKPSDQFSRSTDIGALRGKGLFRGALGAGDVSDTYKVTLPFPGKLTGKLSSNSTQTAGRLDADLDGDGRLDDEEDEEKIRGFNAATPLNVSLPAGTYFVTILGETFSYDLELIPDFAGETPETARNMGTLSAFVQAQDHVAATPTDNDFYRFTINGTQTVTASARTEGGDLKLMLFDLSGGAPLNQVTGTNGFALLQRTLSAGDYFLRVTAATNEANYTVGFSTGDNDDAIPEILLTTNSQMIIGQSRDFTLSSLSDVDMILVNLDAGPATAFSVDVDSRNGSIVDTFLRLFDFDGNQLAFNDDGAAPGESASKFSFASFTVPANFPGDFVFVGISAAANKNYNALTGAGDSGGASSGQYTVHITPLTPSTLGSIAGSVINDLDGDGVKDTNETGVASRTVYIDLDNDSILDASEKSATTSAAGLYTLTSVAAGTHKVRQVVPAGSSQTFPLNNFGLNVTIGAGQNSVSNNFLVKQTAAPVGGSISGNVYNDLDGDGVKDSNESAIAGRTVFIDLDNDSTLDANEKSAITNSSGQYTLTDVVVGTHKVRQIRPAGWSQTFPLNNFGLSVTITTGQNSTSNNFFIRPTPAGTGSISGNVFHDLNRNGIKDSGDNGLAGFTVYLDLDNDSILDTNEQRVLTDSSGNYVLPNLAAGTYKIRIALQSGFVQTSPTNNFGHNATLAAGSGVVTGKNFGADN